MAGKKSFVKDYMTKDVISVAPNTKTAHTKIINIKMLLTI